jgi:hypothetical protein
VSGRYTRSASASLPPPWFARRRRVTWNGYCSGLYRCFSVIGGFACLGRWVRRPPDVEPGSTILMRQHELRTSVAALVAYRAGGAAEDFLARTSMQMMASQSGKTPGRYGASDLTLFVYECNSGLANLIELLVCRRSRETGLRWRASRIVTLKSVWWHYGGPASTVCASITSV